MCILERSIFCMFVLTRDSLVFGDVVAVSVGEILMACMVVSRCSFWVNFRKYWEHFPCSVHYA